MGSGRVYGTLLANLQKGKKKGVQPKSKVCLAHHKAGVVVYATKWKGLGKFKVKCELC